MAGREPGSPDATNEPVTPVPYHSLNEHEAEKEHLCHKCGEPIKPGQRYYRIVKPRSNEAPEVLKIHSEDCPPPEDALVFSKSNRHNAPN